MARPKTTNPADCEEPVCSEAMAMFRKMKAVSAKKEKERQSNNGTGTAGAAGTAGAGAGATAGAASATGAGAGAGGQFKDCPISKDELGNATWALLHTTAAYYPDEPSKELQDHTKAFVTGLAQLYPCSYCREDFKREVVQDPPSVESRLAFSLWTCRQHNTVNNKLGKPTFECTLPRLDERWKTGKKSCWEGVSSDPDGDGHDEGGE